MTSSKSNVTLDDNYNEIIEKNTGLVHSVVKRFTGRSYEYDDLFQVGCIGLCKAASRFDSSLGFSFSTYAVSLIIGEIKRFIRDDGIIKVSRHYKETSIKAGISIKRFTDENGREPSISELSELTGISKEDLIASMEATQSPVSIYPDKENENSYQNEKMLSDGFNDDKYINKIALNTIINSFPPRDRRLIIYRYFKDKTQLETARLLGISQVQVSRIEKNLLEKIKFFLSK